MSKRKTPKQDPFAGREAEKYDNPIPSREFILDLLDAAPGPVEHPELCEQLELEGEEQIEALRRRLIAMARDGQLISNRRGAYARLDKTDLVRGRVQGHRDGYGFVAPAEGGGEDIYLHNRQMRRVFDGDEVLVRVSGDRYRGKMEGTIVEVLGRNTQQLAGRFFQENGVQFVRPENTRITQDIMVPPGAENGAKAGQIVVARITQQPDKNRLPVGEIKQVLGDHMAPGMEIELAIQAHSLPSEWPQDVVAEAEQLPAQVSEADKQHRIDLRQLPFVTIDGEDARDFDDALLCERRKGGGWRLYVAIADVSHYVQVGSALDRESSQRGNSVYFPDYVLPMLPEALSNGLCSLNPEVDRLCMVCEMTIGNQGKVTGYKFYEGVMHSHARLTYTKVAEILAADGDDRHPLRKQYKQVLPQLHLLHRLYQCLRQARDERGAIDFETVETRIEFNSERKIERIVPVHRNDAHKIVEECMLCANVCSARFLEKHNLLGLYRVHQGPKAEKLANLREFLGELGLGLSGGDSPTSADFQQLMERIQDRPDSHMIQMVMLRSLRQAVYQVENEGHFGLGYPAYTHFTSPIRRYPDLLVHRAIRSVIRSEQNSSQVARVPGARPIPRQKIYPYDAATMISLGEHCSTTERRADDATRDVISWLKCEYLQDHVGSVFDGVVSSVTGFGLFVELKDLYVEGLVHITALPRDYYRFDPAQHRLVGERTRKVFSLSDELRVRVVRVNLDDRKVDFELEEVVAQARGKKKPGGGKSGAGGGGKSTGRSGAKAATATNPGKKSGRSSGRGRGNKQQQQPKSHEKQSAKTSQQTQAAAVRSSQKPAAPENQSVLAAATAGVKKAFARFKKKK